MTNALLLSSWNVNGIRSVLKKGALQAFVESVKPDILCLQEVRSEEHQAERAFPDFHEYWCVASRKGYSGTAIFSRIEPLRVVRNLPEAIATQYQLASDAFGNPNAEGRVIAAEFASFWLVNVYAPNSKPDLSRLGLRANGWDPALRDYCKTLEREKPVIVCGDFNVAHTEDDLAHPDRNRGYSGFTNEERESFQKNWLDEGYIDSFRHFTKGKGYYTFWSNFSNARARNLGWRIDYFLVSKGLAHSMQAASIYASSMGSDHCPIGLSINTPLS